MTPNFVCKVGKLASNLEDEYYKNGGNARIQKVYDNLAKIWTAKQKLS